MIPIVSVVTPSYNSSQTIEETIKSVLSQVFSAWELIIVDDCSSDDSVDVIKKYSSEDSRIKLIVLDENSGAAVARNRGIEEASGRYIAFLDSDDIWLPEKLETQLAFMREVHASFVYSAYQKIDKDGNDKGEVMVPAKVSYTDILRSNSIGCLTAMYDTDYFGKVYMPEIRKRQDLGLWLKLLKRVDCAYGINEILAQYRVHSSSISANKVAAAKFQWKLYREIEQLNIFYAFYVFLHYAIGGVLKTKFTRLFNLMRSRKVRKGR